MEFLEGLKTFEFSKHGLIGAVVGGLFFVIFKVLMMFDSYNKKLLDMVKEKQPECECDEPKQSWTERNRIEK